MGDGRWRKIDIVEAAVLGLGGVGLLSILVGSLITDESVFFLVGREMRQGIMPYRDLWDHKGLPIYLVAYLASFFGLLYVQAGRLLVFLFPLSGCLALFYTAGLRGSRRLYLFAGCLGAAVFASLGQGMMTEQVEAGAILWTLAFLLAALSEQEQNKRWPAFMAGVGLSVAVLIRLPALIFIPAVALPFCFQLLSQRRPDGWLKLALFLAGMALPIGLTGVMLQFTGLLDDMVTVYIQGNLAYARASLTTPVQAARVFLHLIAPNILAINGLYLFLGLPGLWQIGRETGRLFWLFLFLLVAAAEALGTRYGIYAHYWGVMFWLLVPGTAYTLWRWQQERPGLAEEGWRLSLGLLFFLTAVPAARPAVARLQPGTEQIARELKAYVQPGDYLWVGGTTGSSLYLYTETRPVSPYIYTGAAAELALEAEQIEHALREKRPVVVIGPEWSTDGQLNDQIPPALHRYLEEQYQEGGIIEDQATGSNYLVLLPYNGTIQSSQNHSVVVVMDKIKSINSIKKMSFIF